MCVVDVRVRLRSSVGILEGALDLTADLCKALFLHFLTTGSIPMRKICAIWVNWSGVNKGPCGPGLPGILGCSVKILPGYSAERSVMLHSFDFTKYRETECVEALLVVWSDLSERARKVWLTFVYLWKSLWVTLIAIGFVLVFKAQLSGASCSYHRSVWSWFVCGSRNRVCEFISLTLIGGQARGGLARKGFEYCSNRGKKRKKEKK